MRTALALLCLIAATSAAPAAHACRQALILALDVSSSVSQREYELQRDGLATALLDPEIRDRIIGAPDNQVELMVFEWGDAAYQRQLLPWTRIDGATTLTRVAATISAQRRNNRTQATGIGGAMDYAEWAFRQRPGCVTLTLDISGDGKNNSGPRPREVRKRLVDMGITINGLVVATRSIAEMSAYYHAEVIAGPQSFVETAAGFDDYGRAIKRKLLRELTPGLASALRNGWHHAL